MTVIVYASTDAGAPAALSNTAGALIAVLDACLVNGYGAKPAAGWAKVFSGTNLAVYRPPAGPRHYLDVNDTGTNTATVRGYEVSTGTGAGTNQFPSTAQFATSFWGKGTASGRAWFVIASQQAFFFAVNYAGGANYLIWRFGAFKSYMANDAFATFIAIDPTAGGGAGTMERQNVYSAGSQGCYAPRGWSQVGTSQLLTRRMLAPGGASIIGAEGTDARLAYPGPDNRLHLSPVEVIEPMGQWSALRGMVPGLWAPRHAQPVPSLSDVVGAEETAGKTFRAFQTSGTGQVLIEISDTWDE